MRESLTWNNFGEKTDTALSGQAKVNLSNQLVCRVLGVILVSPTCPVQEHSRELLLKMDLFSKLRFKFYIEYELFNTIKFITGIEPLRSLEKGFLPQILLLFPV